MPEKSQPLPDHLKGRFGRVKMLGDGGSPPALEPETEPPERPPPEAKAKPHGDGWPDDWLPAEDGHTRHNCVGNGIVRRHTVGATTRMVCSHCRAEWWRRPGGKRWEKV